MREAKIIIINPFDEDASLKDGHIHIIKDEAYFCHGGLLIEYGMQIYGNDSIFGLLSRGDYSPDVPAYFLVAENDNVVFLNISSEKVGKRGLLFLPSELSFEQDESLNYVLEHLKDFSIIVNTNMRIEEGIIDYEKTLLCPESCNTDCKVKKKA